jgi:antitoxin PrlF
MGSSYRSKMSSKGQLVIPAEVRKRLGLRSGTQVTITEDNGRLIIEQRRQAFQRIRALRGILKGEEEAIRKLVEEDKKLEREHEEKLDRLVSGQE